MANIEIIRPYNMQSIKSGEKINVRVKVNSIPFMEYSDSTTSLMIGCEYVSEDNVSTLLTISDFKKITSDGTFKSFNDLFVPSQAIGTYSFSVKDIGDKGIKKLRVFLTNSVARVYSNEIYVSSLTEATITYKAIETKRLIRKVKVELYRCNIINSLTSGSDPISLTIKATNNPFDANPIWVDVKEGEFTELPNEIVADKNGLQVKIIAKKNDKLVTMKIHGITLSYY